MNTTSSVLFLCICVLCVVCLYMFMCMHMSACVWTCVQKQKVNVKYLLSLLFILGFETSSSTDPLSFGWTSWPEISSDPSICGLSVLGSQAQATWYRLRGWDSNSDYFAGMASTSPPEPTPQPSNACLEKRRRKRTTQWILTGACCVTGTAPCLEINAKSTNNYQICPAEFTPSNLVGRTSPTCHPLCMATLSLRWHICYLTIDVCWF